MDLHVSLDGRRDLSGQIYRQLRAAIHDGRLRAGDQLPPSRELASRLSVARNTVGVAYDRLAAEGYLSGRIGAGTYVQDAGRVLAKSSTEAVLRPRPGWDTLTTWPPARWPEPAIAYDFRIGLPDVRMFPFATWRPLVARELRPSATSTAGYRDPAGRRDLRTAIARHIGRSRGVVGVGPDDIIVTNGIQQALDLICRVLLAPGDRVAVESPGYPPAHLLMRSLGLDVIEVPVDDEGLRVDEIPAGVRAVYVTPSHQFPLGMPMSLSRRSALLAWAERTRAAVIEDDYDSEFRYGGRPIESLWSLAGAGQVLYVGSFSKTMLPSLRAGFLVTPPALRNSLRTARYVADWTGAAAGQAALARFIDDGMLARHIRRMRREYEARHQLVTRTIRARFAGSLELVPSMAGLHVTAYAIGALADPGRLDRAVETAAASGVAVYTLAAAAQDESAPPGLVFGYGAIPATEIPRGLHHLHTAVVDV